MADQRQQRRDARDRVKGIAEAQAEARKFLRSLRADITSCKEWVDTLDLPDGYWRHISCSIGFPSWIDDWFKRQEMQVGDVGPFVTFLEYEQYLRVQFRTDADDECCGPTWMDNLMDSWNFPPQEA